MKRCHSTRSALRWSSANVFARNFTTRTSTLVAVRNQRFARITLRASPLQLTPPSSTRGRSPNARNSCATIGSSPGAATAKILNGAVAKERGESAEVDQRKERVLLDCPKVVDGRGHS